MSESFVSSYLRRMKAEAEGMTPEEYLALHVRSRTMGDPQESIHECESCGCVFEFGPEDVYRVGGVVWGVCTEQETLDCPRCRNECDIDNAGVTP